MAEVTSLEFRRMRGAFMYQAVGTKGEKAPRLCGLTVHTLFDLPNDAKRIVCYLETERRSQAFAIQRVAEDAVYSDGTPEYALLWKDEIGDICDEIFDQHTNKLIARAFVKAGDPKRLWASIELVE